MERADYTACKPWFMTMMRKLELVSIQRSYIPECEAPEDAEAVERAALRYSREADRILQAWTGVGAPYPAEE